MKLRHTAKLIIALRLGTTFSATMDFAALMNKELAKSKKPAEAEKKYLKRSEVEAERRAAYLAEQKALEAEREKKAAAKRKREEETAAETAAREDKRRRLAEESRLRREEQELEEARARRKRLGLPELVKATSEDVEDGVGAGGEDVPDEELTKELRALGQPVRLFGESHAARLRRYRKLTTVVTTGPIPTTLALVEGKDMRVDGTVPKDKEGRRWLFRQLASYFTMVLTAYEQAMEEEEKETTASKTAYSAMVQTRENMKPVRSSSPALPIDSPARLTQRTSSSASLKSATSTTPSSSPLSRSSRPCRSAGTSTPTTATCASASARPPGPSASPWSESMSAARVRSCTTAKRATSWVTR